MPEISLKWFKFFPSDSFLSVIIDKWRSDFHLARNVLKRVQYHVVVETFSLPRFYPYG